MDLVAVAAVLDLLTGGKEDSIQNFLNSSDKWYYLTVGDNGTFRNSTNELW